MINIFIGWDERESIAAHVLTHSIISRASIPVSFTYLKRQNLKSLLWRPRDPFDSTDFARSRFLVPSLCDGVSVYMDCDMLMRVDIATLPVMSNPVSVVKHCYVPRSASKFFGQSQNNYPCKNWSSFMLFNHCPLSHTYVNAVEGISLHQFDWIPHERIGELDRSWNHLVGEDNQCDPSEANVIHYTQGTPCLIQYAKSELSELWHEERVAMECG